MANKLNYSAPTENAACRSTRTMLLDAMVGSGTLAVGLFFTIFLAVAAEGWGSRLDELFERPRTMVRRGAVRITKGRQAAEQCRRPIYRSI